MNEKLIQLYQAIATRNLEQIQDSIAGGIDVNTFNVADGMTLLAKAVLLGNVEVAQVLLQAGPDLYNQYLGAVQGTAMYKPAFESQKGSTMTLTVKDANLVRNDYGEY